VLKKKKRKEKKRKKQIFDVKLQRKTGKTPIRESSEVNKV